MATGGELEPLACVMETDSTQWMFLAATMSTLTVLFVSDSAKSGEGTGSLSFQL